MQHYGLDDGVGGFFFLDAAGFLFSLLLLLVVVAVFFGAFAFFFFDLTFGLALPVSMSLLFELLLVRGVCFFFCFGVRVVVVVVRTIVFGVGAARFGDG
jgi:hypothetical protein